MTLRLHYDGYGVPEHTAESLENYLFRGLEPGGFLTSVLSNDLIGACTRCDHVNRDLIVEIVKFLLRYMPAGSWGSMDHIRDWLHDKDGIRSKYVEEFEKRLMWETLTTTN